MATWAGESLVRRPSELLRTPFEGTNEADEEDEDEDEALPMPSRPW